jgi:hypothetical protein
MVQVDTAAIANLSFAVKVLRLKLSLIFYSLKLVMYVPLKTADRQFTLCKLVVTPSLVMGKKIRPISARVSLSGRGG